MSDIILFNASVLTMNPRFPFGRLVAIRNGIITAVAGDDRLSALRTAGSKVIDCRGRTLLPGLIDAHCHLRAFAESLLTVDLSPSAGVRSIADICSRIRSEAQASPPGAWVRGHGYHEFDLADKRHPTRWDLDAASPRHPVKIAHRTGHAHVLNSRALELIGLSRYSEEPHGGLMDRDLTGEPTGLLFEMGRMLAERAPRIHERELEGAVEKASRLLLSYGITTLYDASAGNERRQWEQFAHWKDKGFLLQKAGIYFSSSVMEEIREGRFVYERAPCHLHPLGVKIILDETTGRLFPEAADLSRLVSKAHRLGLQLSIHAVEEGAIDAACEAIDKAQKESPRTDCRHRLEHAFICPQPLIARMASLGVHVVTQPGFLHANGDRYLKTVPEEKQEILYPIGSLMKEGVLVAAGSDCPVGPRNPFFGIRAAVSRATQTGAGLNVHERISLPDALALYTRNAARTGFEEEVKGTIDVGKAADLILLGSDLMRSSTEGIGSAQVDLAVLDGRIAWSRESEESSR